MSDYENYIKVRFDEGETGWANQLGDHPLVIISNVPLAEAYCLGDIVELLNPDDNEIGRLGKVVYREFKRRAAVRYDEERQFRLLCAVYRQLGAKVEGMFGPTENHRGMMMVACNEDIDPWLIAEGMGISQPTEEEENTVA